MSLRSNLVAQFRNPHGVGGRLAGWVMAHRPSNRSRNFWTVDLLDLEPTHRVLEIGFGPGLALERAARRVPDGELIGLDHSATMLAQATARNRAAIAAGRMRLLRGAVDDLPPHLGPFDRIYSANVVQFWTEPARVYARLLALLAPGGLLATTYQPRHAGATAADATARADTIADLMSKAGFDHLRSETLALRPIPAICVLGCRPAQ